MDIRITYDEGKAARDDMAEVRSIEGVVSDLQSKAHVSKGANAQFIPKV